MSAIEAFTLVKEKMEVFVQLRTEKHGEDNANAYDLRLSGDFSNSVLLKLHPDLRDHFYKDSEQREIDEFKRVLRFPRIAKPLVWDLEIPRILSHLHDVDDEANDLVLSGGVADTFKIEMKEGGTVHLSFRIKLAAVDEDQIVKLHRANGQKLRVSVECAEAEEQPDNYEQADLLSREPMSDARAKAESAFSAAPPNMDDVVDATFNPPPEVVEADPVVVAMKPRPKRALKSVGAVE